VTFKHPPRRATADSRTAITAAFLAVALSGTSGCAVHRGQESVGAYAYDAVITSSVKGKFVSSKDVDASSIRVETLNGTVMLSGFAKSETEKSTAEKIAMDVDGVKSVKNEIAVHP
jgi:hyperosmotically inducible protein